MDGPCHYPSYLKTTKRFRSYLKTMSPGGEEAPLFIPRDERRLVGCAECDQSPSSERTCGTFVNFPRFDGHLKRSYTYSSSRPPAAPSASTSTESRGAALADPLSCATGGKTFGGGSAETAGCSWSDSLPAFRGKCASAASGNKCTGHTTYMKLFPPIQIQVERVGIK